uniref:ORF3 n=1 Tax=Bamboo mosaic virus TaxID=35286 RepID=A0A1Q1NIG7_9VIRU|nr:ORF3 [Bamboo mosaic virus]AQM55993.1 ORF3 [Bamboo mosaic virus]
MDQPLHLARPPDNTKSYLVLAIGIASALFLYTLTRNTLPHTGDNIHHLPHGGRYVDGTKGILYNSPTSSYPSSSLPFTMVIALATTLFLITKNLFNPIPTTPRVYAPLCLHCHRNHPPC